MAPTSIGITIKNKHGRITKLNKEGETLDDNT